MPYERNRAGISGLDWGVNMPVVQAGSDASRVATFAGGIPLVLLIWLLLRSKPRGPQVTSAPAPLPI